MKVIWSDFASGALKEIYDYYKETASESVARKIKESIFKSTRQPKRKTDADLSTHNCKFP